MSCTIEADGPCRRTLSFEIERKALEQEIDARLQELMRTSRFKGFRPGKAPVSLVRRTHGKRVEEEARRQLMSKAFSESVQEHQLRPVGQPVMDLQSMQDDDQGPLSFRFEIEVAPEFELQLPEHFDVTVQLAPIDETMIDGELRRLRERFGRLEDAPEGQPVGADDVLEASVTYSVDGETVAQRHERPVFLRHGMVDGLTVEGALEALTGRQLGDLVELTTTLPEDFQPEGWSGRLAKLSLTIDRHRVLQVPDLDEKALATLGVESEEQLRQRIAASLEQQRNSARESQIDRAIEEQLTTTHSFELPERLLARTIDQKVHELAHQLMEQQGQSAEQGHQTAEAQREQIAESARKGLALAFLVDAIARTHDQTASLDEAAAQVRAVSAREGTDGEEAVASAIREGWLGEVQEQLTHEKVRAWLRGLARITEQAPDTQDDSTDDSTDAGDDGASTDDGTSD